MQEPTKHAPNIQGNSKGRQSKERTMDTRGPFLRPLRPIHPNRPKWARQLVIDLSTMVLTLILGMMLGVLFSPRVIPVVPPPVSNTPPLYTGGVIRYVETNRDTTESGIIVRWNDVIWNQDIVGVFDHLGHLELLRLDERSR